MAFTGIDVSSWQGDVNWNAVASSNIDFAMIRASFGTTGVDNKFTRNMSNIVSTSIHPGSYHYTYALNTSQAQAEAQHFLNIIRPYQFTYPVSLDIEDDSLKSLGIQTVTDIALTFCNTVQNAGYYVIIYSNLNFFLNYLDLNRLSNFDIWLAQWSSSPTYDGDLGMWQYTSTGTVNGIAGNVDMNRSYRDFPSIIQSAGLNGTSSTPTPPSPPSVPSDQTTYTVVSGDSLWSIAYRFLGDGALYPEIKSANGLTSDTIYLGQTLVIPSSGSSPQKNYTVVSGDSLWSIAQRFLGDGALYPEIKSASGLTSDTIYPGQTLIIPNN